ncbi:MAG: hypothetical protein ACI4SH_08930 [Candidatus Scatosoma sp.]
MRKGITYLLSALFLLGACGCGESNAGSASNAAADGVRTIYDFESWEELSTCAFKYEFDRATINRDKKYVKSGEASMKIEVSAKTQTPYILFYPGFEPVEKSDFTDVDRIMLDVYNPEDRDISIWMSLDVRSSYGFEMNTTSKEFVLRKNTWNKVVYRTNRESLTRAFSLEEVMHIALRFDTAEEPYALYCDNMQIRTGEPQKEYQSQRQDGELLFFEDDRDIDFFNCTTYYYIQYLYPILDINLDPNYCSEGKKSMRVRIPLSDLVVFPMVELQVDAIDASAFKDAKAISMDIYNANGKSVPVDFHIRDFYRTSGGAPKADLKRQIWLSADSWTTVTFTREELAISTVDIEALKNIGFEFIDQNDKSFGKYVRFYMDNFKIIK